MYSVRRTVDPTVEPVTLDQVKAQCRLDPTDTSQDALLGLYVRAAREYVEEQTGRALLQQTLVLTRDSFPGSWLGAPSAASPSSFAAVESMISRGLSWPGTVVPSMPLPRGAVLSITSLQYFDGTNTLQTIAPTGYVADTASVPARLQPLPGQWWPFTAWRTGAVQVTYVAGYGSTAAAVPASLSMAILQLAAHWFENREASVLVDGGATSLAIPFGVAELIEPFILALFTLET